MDKLAVENVIAQKIRPGIQSHGGGIDLIEVKENKVYVRLTGACGGCPMAAMTMKDGVERALKAAFPDLEAVINV
jgi:Fe-S cluster biogenesis protein NfuA